MRLRGHNGRVELGSDQKGALRERGYARLPGAIPRSRVEAALRAVNASLGRGLRPEDVEKFRAQSFCPELEKAPVLLDLARESGVLETVESVLGPGALERVTHAQVALTFPTADASRPPVPHLDGMYTPQNGVPRGEILSFTALLGVLLSDVPEPGMGNLVVWPGSHLSYERYFREKGPRSLLDGMPKVELGVPEPVTGRAGDAVLSHYQLGHAGGPNTSPHVRYAVYFRLKAHGHDRRKWECLTDLWREWPGMRD
jgi:hypothetical protein